MNDLPDPLPALQPRDADGCQFVLYGDCCSGLPDTPRARTFAALQSVLARLRPAPECLVWLGDAVNGMTKDPALLRVQWRHWLDVEMAAPRRAGLPLYPVAGNHDTYSAASETVWREVFAQLPRNGPPGQEGLAYGVRRGPLLLVAVDTVYSGLGGYGHVEHEWLERTLHEHTDVPFKLVLGHHPIHPVNGYDHHLLWRVAPAEGAAFWDVLARHRVTAYLCSHIIAFDAQVHQGVLQILTGGAGTEYGPGGFMSGRTEYHHLVQAAVDHTGWRHQVLDTAGAVRERLTWPPVLPPAAQWPPCDPQHPPAIPPSGADWMLALRFTARSLPDEGGLNGQESRHRTDSTDAGFPVKREPLPPGRERLSSGADRLGTAGDEPQTLCCGWANEEGPPSLWIGLAEASSRLTVELLTEPGGCVQRWLGPVLSAGTPLEGDVLIHAGMGPGGILWRAHEAAPWSSLRSSSARGAACFARPKAWALGHGPSGPADRPWRGRPVTATWILAEA